MNTNSRVLCVLMALLQATTSGQVGIEFSKKLFLRLFNESQCPFIPSNFEACTLIL